MTPWIGYVEIKARAPGARFWALKTDAVTGRLVMPADHADGFRQALTNALAHRNLDLVDLVDAAPVTETCSPELVDAAAGVDDGAPQLFGRLCDAHAKRAALVTEVDPSVVPASDTLWAVLDGVAWPGLPQILAASGDSYTSLYTSTDQGTLASGPWLVPLREGSKMYDAIAERDPTSHSGIYLKSALPLAELKRHLRRFTMAYIPNGGTAPVYFRFYDPRVLMDLASALDHATLGRLMEPISAFYARLSPMTLVPDHAQTALPVTPFDTEDSCRTRLARIVCAPDPPPAKGGALSMSGAEYGRFQKLHKRKSQRSLARKLSLEFPDREWATYRTTSRTAPDAARRFGLTSVKQVAVVARAIMTHGPDFWDKNPEVLAILSETNVRPWQKKNTLVRWLVAHTPPKEASP